MLTMMMLTLTSNLLLTSPPVIDDTELRRGAERFDRCLVEVATTRCPRGTLAPKLAWDMLQMERQYGLPPHLRGITLAASCGESGYNPRAVGKAGDTGMVQILEGRAVHRWCEREFKRVVNLTDPIDNIECWLARVAEVAETKAARCEKPWRAAHTWVAQGPVSKQTGKSHDCSARSYHQVWLKDWHARCGV